MDQFEWWLSGIDAGIFDLLRVFSHCQVRRSRVRDIHLYRVSKLLDRIVTRVLEANARRAMLVRMSPRRPAWLVGIARRPLLPREVRSFLVTLWLSLTATSRLSLELFP